MIQEKDFSEIIEILKTNGVGFIECFFRTSIYFSESGWNDPEVESEEFRIDFSDGRNYLGSLHTSTKEPDFIGTAEEPPLDPKTQSAVENFQLFLDEKIVISFTFVDLLQGKCFICKYTTDLNF